MPVTLQQNVIDHTRANLANLNTEDPVLFYITRIFGSVGNKF